ncbi:hypothetical protein F6Y05_01575 (plasmid) [Bacillus megaterium]|nr:hypothetical protein [Priestia megaterium]
MKSNETKKNGFFRYKNGRISSRIYERTTISFSWRCDCSYLFRASNTTRRKQETPSQIVPVPSVEEMVGAIAEKINQLMETERLFLRNEWFCMEESMKRSIMEIFQEVEEKQAAKRGELVAAILERYNR